MFALAHKDGDNLLIYAFDSDREELEETARMTDGDEWVVIEVSREFSERYKFGQPLTESDYRGKLSAEGTTTDAS